MDAAVSCRPDACYPSGRKHGRHRVVKRREFITLIGGTAAWPLAARAQRLESCPPLGDAKMSDANRLLFLRIALIVIGLTFIFGIYTSGILWPSGWVWGQGHSHYLMMIIGVYATLGVFL